jgi:hypothetical protein
MAMPDKPSEESATDAIARKLIAQCRNDIAAAWGQVSAARDALGHTRWLRSRWDAHRRAGEPEGEPAAAAADGAEPADDNRGGLRPSVRLSRAFRRRRRKRS